MTRPIDLLFCAAGLGLALMASPASAQPETGRRIDSVPSAVRNLPSDKAAAGRIVLNQYSRCFAKQNSTRVEAALALAYLSPEQENAVKKLNRSLPDCLGSSGLSIRFSAPAMVGGMAEEFVLGRYGDDNLTRVAALTEEAMFASSFKPRNDGEDFAQCVARGNPTGAFAVLQTDVGGDAEKKAVKALVPTLGSCLVAGHEMNLNDDTVRSISAVGLYRILAGLAAADAGK
ncbi:MAG: hypothetical protein JNL35_13895 [Sphingopyxis sp.]|nr:hypothetical protein [Sphingopyxis sp.]